MTRGSCLSIIKQRPESESGAPIDSVQTPDVSDLNPECAGQEQGNEESPGPAGDEPQDVPSISRPATHTDEIGEMVITSIRATDVTLGLRRVPAGFYTVVRHSGLEWRTENKRSSVNHDVVEWSGPILIPSSPSATICLEVYASFEFQLMLGAGEQLRELAITVEQLLDYSAKGIPFTLRSKDGDIVSPCSSILVTINRQKCESSDSSASEVLGPHCSTTGSRGELEDATNQGHSTLSHYRKHGEKWGLERSVEEFERALSICPLDHPCLAAAQSNLAMAKFILCQVEDTDVSFEVPLGLYRSALAARPAGHLDRPSTLIQLAGVHSARFQKQGDEVEKALAEALLHEAMELSSADSHENRVAASMLQLQAERRVGSVEGDGQSSMGQSAAPPSTSEDPSISSTQLLDRFQRFGDLTDLQQAITVLEGLVRSTAVSDDRHSALLGNLGLALWHRFNHVGELSDLEDAILRHKDCLDLTPHGHPHKSKRLSNLGNSFRARFDRLGELSDLENAISTLGDAVDLTPKGHPDKPSHLNNLGSSLRARFNRLGELSDLEDAISTLRDAVDLTPHGHPDKPRRLNNLGNSFRARFQRLGGLSELENAISRQREAVALTPDDHPLKPNVLNNLGNSFFTRFEHLGELSNLEDAILRFREAVNLTPHGHSDKPSRLNNLGNSILTRFKRLGDLSDLEDAISSQREAVDLTPHTHPVKPSRLTNLGSSFRARFTRLGQLSDLEDAISRQRDAVELTPHGHPEKPRRLYNLGNSFLARFERLGELSDLEDAISMQGNAVDLTPLGNPDKPSRLTKLGNSFLTRFERLGEPSDLEDAVSTHREAVDLTPHGHPDRPGCLDDLGNSFKARFKHLGELGDLEDAISRHRDAVDLIPHGHPDKPNLLNNFGDSFLTRFEHLGELSDLDDAISMLRNALDLTPHDHPDKPSFLNNLSNSFVIRFERLGEPGDLEDAISMQRDAVALIPRDHPHMPRSLNNLGNAFVIRFVRLGELRDLENAISMHRDAVDLTPRGRPRKPGYLNNLGNSFIIRFERLGELSDLEDAILRHRDAVDLTPHGHSHKPALLNSLGNSFLTRFEHLGELSDLDDAISTLSDAVDLTPEGHPDKPRALNNLGSSFRARFERLRELNDIEQAILMQKDAVDLTPLSHANKSLLLNQLGNSFGARFKHLGEPNDLEDAILMHRDACNLTPHGHPDKPNYLDNLATSLFARFRLLGDLNDLEHAISLYSHAASDPIGSTSIRFRASLSWISCARHIHHHSLLDACSAAINILPQLAWIGLSLTHRYSELMQGADVVREAAAAALDLGHPEIAVEWLEQGRSIVWGDLFQLRSIHEELSSAYPDHARRLRELSATLEHASSAREKSLSALLEQTQIAAHRTTESLQQEAGRHRSLAIERDDLLHEIRGFPGFERFLLHKEFSRLRASAHSGPVAILNAAETRCDALIVLADVDQVIHVPLPNFTFNRSAGLHKALEILLRDARVIRFDERVGKATRGAISWESLLSTLWNGVVKPVLDALAFSTPGDLSRIFWCPTGPFVFLPIHAAGLYGAQRSSPGHNVSDFIVSSYVPTLAILALSPNPTVEPSSRDLCLLTVRQPPSDGQLHLPGVATELEHIREAIKNSPSAHITLLESSDGTVEEVLSLMKEADWVHFACHGIQDGVDSGLCLADQRRLKLRNIIALSRPHGGLAFLSACQTATGEEDLSDEAIHIAAGMLFAGYGGVVGTMWSISDKLAPGVARDVYGQLFRNGTWPDYREAARALHEAVVRLRHGNASFVEWLPFIHVGL